MNVTPIRVGTIHTGRYGECAVIACRYVEGCGLAVILEGTKNSRFPGEKIATISANVEGANLADGEFCVRDYDLGLLIEDLKQSGMFEDTGKKVPSGYVNLPVWRFADPPEAQDDCPHPEVFGKGRN